MRVPKLTRFDHVRIRYRNWRRDQRLWWRSTLPKKIGSWLPNRVLYWAVTCGVIRSGNHLRAPSEVTVDEVLTALDYPEVPSVLKETSAC